MSVFSLQLDRCLYSIYKLTCTDSQWDLLLLWIPSNIHMARKVDTFPFGLWNTACGNLVLQSGIELGDMALKMLSFNHWTTRELLSSVQFSHAVMSNSLQSHELHHAKPPFHHQLPEFTQTHVHRVDNAIQPSHPLSSPSLPAPNPSQHQNLFQWVNSSHEVAKVLEFQL